MNSSKKLSLLKIKTTLSVEVNHDKFLKNDENSTQSSSISPIMSKSMFFSCPNFSHDYEILEEIGKATFFLSIFLKNFLGFPSSSFQSRKNFKQRGFRS